MSRLKTATNGTTNGTGKAHAEPVIPVVDTIEIPRMELGILEVKIIGKTPLLVHAWDSKTKQMMLDKQMKKAKVGKEARDPQREYEASRYISRDGWDGVPAGGFKAALVGACRACDRKSLPMTMAKRLFFIKADGYTKHGDTPLVRIEGEHTMHEAMVRLDGGGSADLRFRAIYPHWSCVLKIEFNRQLISADQIYHLVEIAGHSEGICEWRPSAPKSASGEFGRWELADRPVLKAS